MFIICILSLLTIITITALFFYKTIFMIGIRILQLDYSTEQGILKNSRLYINKWRFRTAACFLLLTVVIAANASIAIVPVGHSGILRDIGQKILPYSLPSGLHFKLPWETVQNIDVRRQVFVQDYEGSSLDQQTVNAKMFIVFKIKGSKVHEQAQKISGDAVKVVLQPAARDTLKAQLAKYSVSDLLLNRDAVNNSVEATLQKKLSPYFFEIKTVSIGDVEFAFDFEARIEDKQVKEQFAMQAKLEQQLAEKQAKIAEINAKGDAEKNVLEQEGLWQASYIENEAIATANKKIALADAKGNELIQNALAKSNLLVHREFVKKWNGTLPNYQYGNSIISNISAEVSTIIKKERR
jgi:regulator of protease activity HflC (stomatin/prohibitin superfamily)